jgi:hypothetical protein
MMDLQLQQNDLLINGDDFAVTLSDVETVRQSIKIRLKTLAGEWFLDSQIGIPYLTEILGHKRNDRFLRHVLMSEIESVPGVLKVSDFYLEELAYRGLRISFEAVLIDHTKLNIKESVEI